MQPNRLFHISENPTIKVFEPRPSPSHFDSIHGDVVFAISETRLHNYLFPRDCPRVTFYSKDSTSEVDKEKFLGNTTASFIVVLENKWLETIEKAQLYCYEFRPDNFVLLDEGAGYYVSYKSETPLSMRIIKNCLEELEKRPIEVRFVETLWPLAQEVAASTLQFSLIRMRNAVPES
ncbi:DUF6886 family protein [Spirosoma litoris]